MFQVMLVHRNQVSDQFRKDCMAGVRTVPTLSTGRDSLLIKLPPTDSWSACDHCQSRDDSGDYNERVASWLS
jgi:hypothetical protein